MFSKKQNFRFANLENTEFRESQIYNNYLNLSIFNKNRSLSARFLK